jgi:hypothetical protein
MMYFLAAVRARQQGNWRFTLPVVGFFLLTFLLKMRGVFVHFAPQAEGVDEVWAWISIGLVVLNCLILHSLRFSAGFRLGAVFFFVACTVLFIERKDFTFLAVEILAANLAAALYCSGLLRIGFAGVAASNLVWIGARKATEAHLRMELPTEFRYDNDLFHFMLIASTYLIYKGFARGSGLPKSFARESASEAAKAVE